MNDDKKAGSPWSKIIIGIIIYALFMLWVTQRNENEQAKQEFAIQTARAENQNTASKAATKQLKDKVKGCVDITKAANPYISSDCVVGYVYNIEEIISADSSEPTTYYTHLSPEPNTFFLYGAYAPWEYVGDCVKVWGEMRFTPDKIPAIYLDDNEKNIEKLPDEMCLP